MKREIKFRAWDTNEFLDEPEMYSNEKLNELDRDGLLHLYDIIEGKEPKVFLMQYTGLKDRTGKEIYEGDIVKWINEDFGADGLSEVRWGKQLARFEVQDKDVWYQMNPVKIHYEIIGNIYATPELLNTPPVNP